MNRIYLTGNLVRDPETRATASGKTVCTFTVAVDRRGRNQDGEKQTDFFRINAWRTVGESCARFLHKGQKVGVFGELQASLYEAKDGATKISLDVSADDVEFLSPKSDAKKETPAETPNMGGFTDISSDDIPF